VRVAIWNVGSLTSKLREVIDTMIRRRVNILYVQKTKWMGQNVKEVEDIGLNFGTQEIR
jgi:exonuclease III